MSNLEFLEEFINPKNDFYETPSFLKSNFLDSVWVIEYSDGKKSEIDFNVKMGDGLYLTDNKHQKTLNTLKYWILFHTLENKNETKSRSIMSESIFSIITFFDAFNIFRETTQIEKYGFQNITGNFLKYLLELYSNSTDKFISLYGLKERVIKKYCELQKINKIGEFSSDDIDDLNKFKEFYNELSLKDLYSDTILKPIRKPKIESTNIDKVRITQEYENILKYDLDNDNAPRSILSIRTFKIVLFSLKEMYKKTKNFKYEVALPNPIEFENMEYFETLFKEKGRFKTVPSNIIFSYVKEAIEFHYQYGKEIIDTYVDFYYALNRKKYNFNDFKQTEEIEDIFYDCLSPKLKSIGVSYLKSPNNKLYDGKERFDLLRSNIYFYDLLKVYYGAVQVFIGAIMARRQSEICSLIIGECIDEHTNSLIFKQSKSTKGMFGTRNALYLPIDPLGIEMIKNLERLHINRKGDLLFLIPTIKNIFSFNSTVSNTTYSENIDFFIDYINPDLVDGKRYYIRQHQLRRFFAMSFFWGSGFGSLDTLRWFLGHTDVQHVYNYITEASSGEVLKSVKTQFLLENIEKYENLLNLIKYKYKTEQYDLINTEDLEYYISELIENEKIKVEPEFVEDNDKLNYKIIVKVQGENYV